MPRAAASRPSLSAGAARQRRKRERQRAGRIHLAIEADEVSLVAVLVESGRLNRNLADDPKAIATATQRLIAELTVADIWPDRHA
jgi:hypothetical protein